jgi:hypothetical protein
VFGRAARHYKTFKYGANRHPVCLGKRCAWPKTAVIRLNFSGLYVLFVYEKLCSMETPPAEQWLLMDIETVSAAPDFQQLDANWQELWAQKVHWQLPAETTASEFYAERAAVMAEFGKVVCISIGYFRQDGGGRQLRLKSIAGHNEKQVLEQFVQVVGQLLTARKIPMVFCGHNIREFDVPYLCRRLLINGLPLPTWLDFQALKPWEVPLLDTLQLWRFGDHKNYTSLHLLAACLGLPSPKTDMDGSRVGKAYWIDQDIESIARYCQQDVATVAQVLLRLTGQPLLQPAQIVST